MEQVEIYDAFSAVFDRVVTQSKYDTWFEYTQSYWKAQGLST